MFRRGPSDSLSLPQCQSLEADLRAYILGVQSSSEGLWQFGVYGKVFEDGYRFSEKSAPVIEDLLENKKLWTIMLRYFTRGKVKDRYITGAMHNICSSVRRVNNTTLKDALFIVWFNKAVHQSMSHIRELARYPAKFAYRVSKLSAGMKEDLEALCSLVYLDIAGSSAEDLADGSSSIPSEIPADPSSTTTKTSAGSSKTPAGPSSTTSKTSAKVSMKDQSARIAKVLSQFSAPAAEDDQPYPKTPPRKVPKLFMDAIAHTEILPVAMHTPPLPCAKGAIRNQRDDMDAKQSPIKVCVERRRTGDVATTLRVYEASSKKRTFWCQLKPKDSKQHEDIIRQVAAEVSSGAIDSKHAAHELMVNLVNRC